MSMAAVVGSCGQKVPPRPWSMPEVTATGTPVPPTLRKFTLSKMTPEEPPPVVFSTSDRPVPEE